MPERTTAWCSSAYARRVAPKTTDSPSPSAPSSPPRPSSQQRWLDLPQDLGVLMCQCLGPRDVVGLVLASRRACELGLSDNVWRFFCRSRWGDSANFRVYSSAKALYHDGNGWFPRRGGRQQQPRFELQRLRLHNSPCLTMDLRITDEEIVAVSEAPRDAAGGGLAPSADGGLAPAAALSPPPRQQAGVQILGTASGRILERFEVSPATINCCDVGGGNICLGSDDSKVRLYRRGGSTGAHCGDDRYRLVCEYACSSVVNDLRFAREDAVLAVRTHQNRHPAGMDIIPLARPDARVSFPGGSWATRGKFIHAIDGFEDGCSLKGVACSGEHPLTSAFSAMLFDFRRPAPCVVDLAVACVRQGHPVGTMLWPLRAGRAPKVYANLLHEEGQRRKQGTIAMVDFRYPSTDARDTLIHLPGPVDDFRYFDGSIYAACTDTSAGRQRLRVLRCGAEWPGHVETISTVDEAYDAEGRSPREDLKVFSVCQRGFVASYGEHLALGSIAEPSWRCWPPAEVE